MGSEMTESRSGGSSERLGQYRKSMVVAIGLCAYQQFSGVNAVMMYTTNICKSAGMADPAAMSTVVMGAQVVLTLISCVLMEKLGRRPLLLFGSASMAVGHMVLALYFSVLMWCHRCWRWWHSSSSSLASRGVWAPSHGS